MEKRNRYQMRKAAGLFWLLDMEQDGPGWKEPAVMNESGAYIWERYQCLKSEEAVAEELYREHGVPVQEALADIRRFLRQLKEQGIVPEQ
ncbi:MAG: PqqD family protein [Lachnospiraceae bacterium]|nr:PqqD family protein [Butyrivibrio sp.]MCM1344174.1 PqqD family protein [Muribaculaceae bacterium]MCM1411365.1 PqqD family protein [Lachnospiraceae bacterium]